MFYMIIPWKRSTVIDNFQGDMYDFVGNGIFGCGKTTLC